MRPFRVPVLQTVLAAIVVFWLALANWRHPMLRLTTDDANLVAFWFLLLLPWVALFLTVVQVRGWKRWPVLALVVPSLLVGAIPLAGTTWEFFHGGSAGSDGAYLPLHRVTLPRGGALEVYQVACGGMCASGVVVRHERPLIPGVLLVRNVYGSYGEYDATVVLIAPDRARVNGQELHLRSWIYL